MYELPEVLTAVGIVGGGIGIAGAGLSWSLKAAATFLPVLRAPHTNGTGGYATGRDLGTLIAKMDTQTDALGALTAEIHDLAGVNREVLARFDATLEEDG